MSRIIVFSICLMLAISANAQRLSNSEVHNNASQFSQQLTGKTAALKPVALKSTHLYAYNMEGGGFIIASSDSRTRSILAYSTKGEINLDSMPDNVAYWLSEYDKQIEQLGGTTLSELQHNYQPDKTSPKNVPDSVAPLLVTEWNQYLYGYNSMVPYDSVMATDTNMARFDGHPTVGCGALAMAQIMRYWQFPQHGVSHHSYTHEGEYDCWRYGTLSADFANTTYDYANMPAKLSESSTEAEVEAVATLCYHCGVSANMMYNSDCQGSSGSTISGCLIGLQHYFHYSPDATCIYKYNSSTATWINLLKNEIGHSRPVLYGGQSYRDDEEGTLNGGHAFVFDGYDNDNFFHVNWGWNGSCNGYFSVDVLRPMTQYDFTPMQYCIIGLKPSYTAMPILTMASDLILEQSTLYESDAICGTYSITNIGDTVGDLYWGVNVYNETESSYSGCLDGRHIYLEPGDTTLCRFYYHLDLPDGDYTALMQYSTDSFYAGIPVDETMYYADPEKVFQTPFRIIPNESTPNLTNVIVAARFADQEEYSYDTYNLCRLLMDKSHKLLMGYTSYANIQPYLFKSLTVQQHVGTFMNTYQDSQPIDYYFPTTEAQPSDCFTGRQQQLIANIASYIETVGFGSSAANLDFNNDGIVDNLTIFIPGDEAKRLSFPIDAASGITLNGILVRTVNIIPVPEENDTMAYYSATRGMLHSLGMPNLSHQEHYTQVHPCDQIDILDNGHQRPANIMLYKYLHVGHVPQRIHSDGTFCIHTTSATTAPTLYYIPSAIDSNQWFTIEYRTTKHENGEELLTLLIGRWMNTMPIDRFLGGNASFNNTTHPNQYWLFRPGSDNDTNNGSHSPLTTLTAFGPNTDPHPYLADGTPDNTFEITNIHYTEDSCTFDVHILTPEDIADINTPTSITAYPNPTNRHVTLKGLSIGTPIMLYNEYGVLLRSSRYDGSSIDLSTLPHGIYHLSTPSATIKIVKL